MDWGAGYSPSLPPATERATKMIVIKVIVDEMPEDCLLCKFLRHYTPHKNTDWEGCDELYCDIRGEEVAEDGRPDWCPLELEDTYNMNLMYAYLKIVMGAGNDLRRH